MNDERFPSSPAVSLWGHRPGERTARLGGSGHGTSPPVFRRSQGDGVPLPHIHCTTDRGMSQCTASSNLQRVHANVCQPELAFAVSQGSDTHPYTGFIL